MKVKVNLTGSTMKAKNWLEIEKDGDYYVSLRSAKGIVGGERTNISRVVLRGLAEMSPGVILKVGPLRFFRTDKDVRISFTEDEEGISGYDQVDHEKLVDAIDKVIGKERKEEHETPRKKKAAASKPKRRVASARKKSTKARSK